MQSKLHIDLSQGLVEVEGEADLVREIYRDLKDHLLSGAPQLATERARASEEEPAPPTANGEARGKVKRRTPARRKSEANGDSSGIEAKNPKLDKNLDTSKLAAFYGQYAPRTNVDKILIFLKYIIDELGIENPNTDQVYTCFKRTGEKIPKAYAQAFYDTSTKHGFIEFRSPTDISLTIAGDNHFNHDLPKKTAE